MHNFVFHNPTKVIFGKGSLDVVGKESSALGKKALLVYGMSSIKQSGLYDCIQANLAGEMAEVIDFGGTRPNPVLSHVHKGIEIVKKNNIEVIVGAGGGSVIDTAKAISAGAVVNHDVWKFFTGKKSVKAALPVLTVLTLPGSGSEMNSGMVLTDEKTGKKLGFGHRCLFPATSILDPEITFTVPENLTAFGSIDAMSHLLEIYLSTREEDIPIQKRLMENLICTIMSSCERCLAEPRDYGGRASLMWAASLALSGFTSSGLGRLHFGMHLVEHSISGLYNTPHGAGLAAIMSGWLTWYAKKKPTRLARLGTILFPDLGKGSGNQYEQAARCIEQLSAWMKKTGAPACLNDLNIPYDAIDAIAEHSAEQARTWRMREFTPARVKEILQGCFL